MALQPYATVAGCQGDLPDSLPSEMDSAFILARIMRATAIVDGSVGSKFSAAYNSSTQKFDPDNIPAIIEQITQELAVSYCLKNMGRIINTGEAPTYAILQSNAKSQLNQIREGELQVIDPDGTTLGVSSDITHNMSGIAPTISKGRYDADGTLQDDNAGTLDGWDW